MKKKVKSVKKSIKKKEQAVEIKPAEVNKSLDKALEAISKLSVNAEQDLTPLVESLISIQKTQQEIMLSISKNQREWEFAVERSQSGRIKKILAREI